MKWIKVEDELPPFGVEVLAWNTCEYCRDKIAHAHDCMARGFPPHGPLIATYIMADPFAAEWLKKKGDESYVEYLAPRWRPATPSHWAKIESPYGDK